MNQELFNWLVGFLNSFIFSTIQFFEFFNYVFHLPIIPPMNKMHVKGSNVRVTDVEAHAYKSNFLNLIKQSPFMRRVPALIYDRR